ncbi:hypothetical protein [Mycolicibacterium xanthum]|uniref:hypothetical protein n=1 Tax=Mycolicibacterium xanthum TaxID=2796469 RepID=UPI002104BA91|nr:hypothetical protein [Mycolicibacterium xanthum]
MTTDHVTFDNPVWGSPDPAQRRWGARETAVAVGIAAVIAGLGGAAIYAATGQSSQVMGPPGHQGPGPGAAGFGAPGAGPAAGPGAAPLHGQFVVADPAGGFTTMLTQTGTVTAASATTFTVRSDDGFSQTYQTSGGSGVAVDGTVTVRGVQDGDTVTATEALDPQQGPARPGAGAPPDGAPTR